MTRSEAIAFITQLIEAHEQIEFPNTRPDLIRFFGTDNLASEMTQTGADEWRVTTYRRTHHVYN